MKHIIQTVTILVGGFTLGYILVAEILKSLHTPDVPWVIDITFVVGIVLAFLYLTDLIGDES